MAAGTFPPERWAGTPACCASWSSRAPRCVAATCSPHRRRGGPARGRCCRAAWEAVRPRSSPARDWPCLPAAPAGPGPLAGWPMAGDGAAARRGGTEGGRADRVRGGAPGPGCRRHARTRPAGRTHSRQLREMVAAMLPRAGPPGVLLAGACPDLLPGCLHPCCRAPRPARRTGLGRGAAGGRGTQRGADAGGQAGRARADPGPAAFRGQRGELRQAYREGQEDQPGVLGLVLNTAVLWNTSYIDAAVAALRPPATRSLARTRDTTTANSCPVLPRTPDAVDSGSVRDDLAGVVHQAVEPRRRLDVDQPTPTEAGIR